ncbi:MAG TPA: hypothetical protein PK616_08540 [Fibrobacteraceae bacterium]|nr:hypothetical protein [Fibrobacteraceae bacterium]
MGKNELEKRMQSFLSTLQEQKALGWESRFHEILDAFEDFLINRPEPPEEWKARLGADVKKYDYYQIVLPADFEDPYEEDLGNIHRLRAEFEAVPVTMAIEHLLISRNYFIFENGHADPIPAPRPLLMLESVDDEGSKIDWDCCITVFSDGSFYAYNIRNDQEEVLGEDIKAILEDQMDVLCEMQLVIPVEGRDYGILRSE